MSGNFILGSGISALIFKYYNPEFKIVSPDVKVGGQLTAHPQLLTTFYVHNTEETKQLLDELSVPFREKRLKIYYYHYGSVLESLTPELRSDFIRGKLREWNYDSNSLEISNLNLSVGNNYLDILDCDISVLIEKLVPDDIIFGSVKLINNNRKFFVYQDRDKNLITQDYDMLVSSIPANIFFTLTYNYKCSYNFNYLPSTFISSRKKPDFMSDDNAIYYVLSDVLPFSRAQKFRDYYVYEISGLLSDAEIAKFIPDVAAVERRYVGIIRDAFVKNFKSIKFIGRNACWDSNVKIQDVIRYAMEFKNG